MNSLLKSSHSGDRSKSLVEEGTNAVRSRIMAAVKQRHTGPEIVVRQVLHASGYRFRLHCLGLPGTPDILLPKHRAVIFVHGCFWHRHPGCRRASTPKTRVEFWTEKFDKNLRRDAAAIEALEMSGWRCLVIWECETRDRAALRDRLAVFLNPNKRFV